MKIILLSILTIGISSQLAAQTDFSGTWKLTDKQHINGPEYTNALPEELTVKQSKDSINTGKTSVAMNGGATTIVNKETNRKSVRTLTWSGDKKTATVTTVIYVEGSGTEVELTRIDAWALSADGKQLSIDRKSVETKSESWETKGVYTKQKL